MSACAGRSTVSRRVDILSQYAGETVLAVGAHPDDLELGVGGTLARLSLSGVRVVMAVISIPSSLQTRRIESRRAASTLGCEVRLLTPDRCSRVEDLKTHQLVSLIDDLVSELKPAAMLTHCFANLHLDHKLVHDACLASQRLRYFDILCYSPTSCHAVNIAFQPHIYIDITKTIDVKMRAIQLHRSQFERRGLKTEHYRDASNQMGRIVGVDFAEGLEVVRMRFN